MAQHISSYSFNTPGGVHMWGLAAATRVSPSTTITDTAHTTLLVARPSRRPLLFSALQ